MLKYICYRQCQHEDSLQNRRDFLQGRILARAQLMLAWRLPCARLCSPEIRKKLCLFCRLMWGKCRWCCFGNFLRVNANICALLTLIILTLDWSVQHASSDVEKMVLGNKCDMEDRRLVSKERGTQVDLHVACACAFLYSVSLTVI